MAPHDGVAWRLRLSPEWTCPEGASSTERLAVAPRGLKRGCGGSVVDMASYRVTKYDPAKRDRSGRYGQDEWTSRSDVGLSIGGKVLSLDEYQGVEDAYVKAIERFMAAAGVRELQVVNLELRGRDARDTTNPGVEEALREGAKVSGSQLAATVRACLRERMWCRLIAGDDVFVHFGYDYYMYVRVPDGVSIPSDLPSALFVEEFESPYAILDE